MYYGNACALYLDIGDNMRYIILEFLEATQLEFPNIQTSYDEEYHLSKLRNSLPLTLDYIP